MKRTRSPSPEGRLASPILAMDGYDEINRFMCSKIEEQDAAMVTVTEKLQQLCKARNGLLHDGPQNLSKLVFAGPSGCGKTETVRCLRYLLGMEGGYENEGQFIEVEPDGELDTLVISLNQALNTYDDREEQQVLRYRRKYPRFMMMIVDDVSTRFISSINTLLSSARLTTPLHSFRLPQETMLLIVFTCNYGEAQIREMKYRVEHEACYFIQSDMYQHELTKNQVTAMGKVVPFYPLKPAALRSILMKRLEEFIANSDICQQFGEIKYDGNVKNMLIDKVIDLTLPGCGIRSGLGELFEKINGFFEKALRELNRKEKELKLRKNKQQQLQQHGDDGNVVNNLLVLSLREIDAKEMEAKLEEECDAFIREIIQSLLKDPQSMEMIQYHREKDEHINALSMHFDTHHLATSDLCGSVVYAHQQNNLFNHCSFGVSQAKYKRLKEENKGLRRAIDRVGTLLYQHGTANVGGANKHSAPIFKEIRDILTESTRDIVMYNDLDDSDDDLGDADDEYDENDVYRPSIIRNRVEEVLIEEKEGNHSGEMKQLTYQEQQKIISDTTTTSTSEEEEEEEETKADRWIRLYGNLDSDELSDVSLPTSIDESSGEERKKRKETLKRKNNALKEKLLRQERPQFKICKGDCGLLKSVRSFNPTLKSNRGGPKLSLRGECNYCRKPKKK